MPFSDEAGHHQGFISRTSTSLPALAFTRSRLNCTLATFRRDGSHGRSLGDAKLSKSQVNLAEQARPRPPELSTIQALDR
jgi:hypothetical protein